MDQRRNSACDRALAEITRAVLPDARRRSPDCILHDASGDLRLLWQQSGRGHGARKSWRDDAPAHGSRIVHDWLERGAHAGLALAAQLLVRRKRRPRFQPSHPADALHFPRPRRGRNRSRHSDLSPRRSDRSIPASATGRVSFPGKQNVDRRTLRAHRHRVQQDSRADRELARSFLLGRVGARGRRDRAALWRFFCGVRRARDQRGRG